MSRTIGWGVVGASRFALNHMAPAIHAAPGGRLVAIASRSGGKRSEAFGRIVPDLVRYDGYERLLDDPEIEAVYIPLPNSLHVEWTRRALRAGKHVLCEKPIAMRAEEIDGLITERDRSGKLAAEAFMIVHHPQWQSVREQLRSGAIGALRHVEGMFAFRVDADSGNIRNRPELGGGALRDVGVYPLGAARYVSGLEPLSLRARMRHEGGIDAFTHLSGEFPGFTFSAVASIRSAPMQRMRFHGEAGTIEMSAPFTASLFGDVAVTLHRPGEEARIERHDRARQYELQAAAFNRSVLTGQGYDCPLEFSRGTQAAVDRALASASPMDWP